MNTDIYIKTDNPKKKRRRNRTLTILSVALGVIISFNLLYTIALRGEALLPQNMLVIALINVNAILLLLLIFLVIRNIVKLFFERRRGILGARLRTKLVIAFVGLSLVPTLLLFWVSIGFITNTIENWFSFKVETSLEESFKVTETFYKNSADNALHYARQMSRAITENRLLNEPNLDMLRDFVSQKQAEYNLGVVEIFSAQLEELSRVMNPDIPHTEFIGSESNLVRQALGGGEVTQIRPAGEGDVIRGVVPVFSTFQHNVVVGAVVVNYYVPKSLVSKMDTISTAFQEYRQLKIYKNPIKLIYGLLLTVVTLLIIFSATWFGFHLSRVITVPISMLANATQQVAKGNLDIHINQSRDDEIGELIESFNKMTRDLSSSRQQVDLTTHDLQHTIQELEHRKKYMEILLDNVAAFVISIDKDGFITNFNRSAEKMLDISMDKALNMPYKEIFKSDNLKPLCELIDEICCFGLTVSERQVALVFREKTMFLYVRSNMLFDNEENYMGLVLIAEDLTQIQQAQRAFAWREVARKIAHEVKNPLTPIKLSAQRLRKKFQPQISSDTAVFDECTKTIINQVDELKNLVNEFSSFARMPATNPVPNNINDIIEETVALYKEAHQNIRFKFIKGKDMTLIHLDREQIKRAMINLLDNAVDAMENKGKITLKTACNHEDGILTVEVSDTGCGIAPQMKPKIFEPYSSTKSHGTGLGLAIVNTIISDHNGYIRVKDNQPKGACFIIEIPFNKNNEQLKGIA